jgi:hypothetical protein
MPIHKRREAEFLEKFLKGAWGKLFSKSFPQKNPSHPLKYRSRLRFMRLAAFVHYFRPFFFFPSSFNSHGFLFFASLAF